MYLFGLNILILLTMLGCNCIPSSLLNANNESEAVKLTILHTNDHHGQFWKNSSGEWGMPARASLIQEIRQEVLVKGGNVLLLSAGDINTGTPASDMNDAKPDFIGMNYMNYR